MLLLPLRLLKKSYIFRDLSDTLKTGQHCKFKRECETALKTLLNS